MASLGQLQGWLGQFLLRKVFETGVPTVPKFKKPHKYALSRHLWACGGVVYLGVPTVPKSCIIATKFPKWSYYERTSY